MTVLRSREISSSVNFQTSKPSTPKNESVEPATPSKNFEFLFQSSNTSTPSSSSSVPNCGTLELGLESGGTTVSETGTVRRRSARLVKKMGMIDCLEDVEVVSGKRKKVERSFCSGTLDVTSSKGQMLDVKLEVENLGEVPDASKIGGLYELGDGGSAKSDTDCDEVKDDTVSDIETFKVETVNDGRLKRKCAMEVESQGFELSEKDDVERGLLSLRSGKRVAKREMKGDAGYAGNCLEKNEKSKESGSGDVPAVTRSKASMEDGITGSPKERKLSSGEKGKGKHGLVARGSVSVKFEVDDRVGLLIGDSNRDAINPPKTADLSPKERRLTRGEKGKGKVGSVMSGSVSVNFEVDDRVGSIGDSNRDAISSRKADDLKDVAKDKGIIISEAGVKTRGRLSKEEKGKAKLGVQASSSGGADTTAVNIENGNSVSGTFHSAANGSSPDGVQVAQAGSDANRERNVHRERFRDFARRNASRFAHFSSQQEVGNHAPSVAGEEIPLPQADREIEDWPGPFSTAMKIIKDRKRYGYDASTDKSTDVKLKWTPNVKEQRKHQKQAPSLQDLCLLILSKNAKAITSLEFVLDVQRHKMCWFLCDSRRMDAQILELLVHGSPTEIRIRDGSWLSEELFTKTFVGCDVSKLMVFQFDQCGRCMPDSLARSTNSLPALTTISLKGAYSLTDTGLSMLVSAAPALKSIDISQCPTLTSEGICCLANSLRLGLRELYLDNSDGIDAMIILPSLLKLENLEVLSLAGIQTVCDQFVRKFISVHGRRMKELVFADCLELTDSSFEIIGDTCSELQAIDLTNLCKLTDVSIGHLANGCRAIQILKLCRNAFSDEAVAAYLDVCGASLKDLSLNHVVQVSNHTALSLSKNCRNIRSLDLSWCRKLTNEALGLIVDSCLSLEVLNLFGCSQVTNVFLDGHSNPQVKLIGLKMTPVFEHMVVPDFLQGPLRYSSISP